MMATNPTHGGLWDHSSSRPFPVKSLQEPYLARVVDVVRGDARDHRLRRPAPDTRVESGLGQSLHDLAELPVLALEEELRDRDLFRGGPRRREKEVRALDRERPALAAGEPAPDRVLPIGGMENEVVNRVSLRAGPEKGDGRRDAAKRAFQVRAVPRLQVVSAVEGREEMRAKIHAAWSISARALAQPRKAASHRERKRPEDVVAGRPRAERRVNEEQTVDPNAAERPRGNGATAHGRGDCRRAVPVPRACQREVRGERPEVARKSPAEERERDRLRERDERLASCVAADPDDLRRAPSRKAPETLQLEVEARHARGRHARRAADVLHSVFGKLVEKTKRHVALGGGYPPELAFRKVDATRGERRVEHRIANGDGEEGADLLLLLLFFCLFLVGLGEEPRLRAGLAAECCVSRADRAVPAEILEAVRTLLDEHALEHLLAPLAEEIRRGVFVVLSPPHGGIIGASREAGGGGRNRTADKGLMRPLLWPSELRRPEKARPGARAEGG